MDLDLRGKRALVTGGSRGIGHAIALALAKQGVAVAVCTHHENETTLALSSLLTQFSPESYVLQTDVNSPDEVVRMTKSVQTRFGSLDILINNAGTISHIPLATMKFEQWQQVLSTNLTSLYLVTHTILNLLNDGGSIINIGAAGAAVGLPARAHYTAAKAGVVGFSRSLCKELGSRNIRVNVIAPGVIDTHQAADLSLEQRSRYESMSALGRLGQSEDIANVALFLASDLASMISGATVVVDGGI